MRVGIPIADLTAGGFAAQGVLLGLLRREHTGIGQWIQNLAIASTDRDAGFSGDKMADGW